MRGLVVLRDLLAILSVFDPLIKGRPTGVGFASEDLPIWLGGFFEGLSCPQLSDRLSSSPSQGGPPEVGPTQVGIPQIGLEQVHPSQIGSTQVGKAQDGPLQVGPEQVCTAQVGTVQVGPSQADT